MFTVCTGRLSKRLMLPESSHHVIIHQWAPLLALSLLSNVYMEGPAVVVEHMLNPLTPQTGLWYLQCCVIWQLMARPLLTLRTDAMIFWCFVVSLLGGYWFDHTNPIALNEALNLLPFFFIGLTMEDRHVKWIQGAQRMLGGAALSAALLSGTMLLSFTTWHTGAEQPGGIVAY
eukprot:gene8587-10195_t